MEGHPLFSPQPAARAFGRQRGGGGRARHASRQTHRRARPASAASTSRAAMVRAGRERGGVQWGGVEREADLPTEGIGWEAAAARFNVAADVRSALRPRSVGRVGRFEPRPSRIEEPPSLCVTGVRSWDAVVRQIGGMPRRARACRSRRSSHRPQPAARPVATAQAELTLDFRGTPLATAVVVDLHEDESGRGKRKKERR
eukprot:307955-Chlamydomonas_euryale.AAC.3